MKTIVVIAQRSIWELALKFGQYKQSTITSKLEDVGFIHCTSPSQTLDIAQRFVDYDDVVLLLINTDKVTAPLKYEAALSGRSGKFPHIYGPLNVDAVFDVVSLTKDIEGTFTAPIELIRAKD